MVWPVVINLGRAAVTWVGRQALQRPIISLTGAHIVTDGESTKAIREGIEGAVTTSLDIAENLAPETARALKKGGKTIADETLNAWSEMAEEGAGLIGDLGVEGISRTDIGRAALSRSPAKIAAGHATLEAVQPEAIETGEACSIPFDNPDAISAPEVKMQFNEVSDAIGDARLKLSLTERISFNILGVAAALCRGALGNDSPLASSFERAALHITQDDVEAQLCASPLTTSQPPTPNPFRR